MLIRGVVSSPVRGVVGSGFGEGAEILGPYPAPAGYRWEYIVEDGQLVAEDSQLVVDLERLAA